MDTKPKAPVKKILVFVLIVVLGLAIYLFLNHEWNKPPLHEKDTQPQILGSTITVPPAVQTTAEVDICKETREKLQGFFAYLDRQDYVVSRQLKGGSFEHFKRLLAQLIEKPPRVQLETDDLTRVLQNKTHFYRVLGKKNTLLIRDIIQKEGDIMEPFFAILYQAMVLQEKCTADGSMFQVSVKDIYPYAVFFLNTLGGSSYLIRRDSRIRMLTQYYCILFLDQANHLRLNRLGLDIRPQLDILTGDLKGAANLARKAEYLDTLKTIRSKY